MMRKIEESDRQITTIDPARCRAIKKCIYEILVRTFEILIGLIFIFLGL